MKNNKRKIIQKGDNLFLSGLLPLERSNLVSGIIAGLILAAVGIPEVMGYAKIAGMPIITGLYTILFPIAIFALFCSSRRLIVGADSATAAILASALVPLAAAGSPNYVALASTVALICAVFLILANIFKLGFIANFMSRTVLVGFLTGVGIQVSISQLSTMLGLAGGGSGLDTIPQLTNVLMNLSHLNIATIIVSVIVVFIILAFRYISPKIPGALIAVIGTIIASLLINFPGIGVSVIGFVPSGFPSISLPVLPPMNFEAIQSLIITALTCFIVIIAQSAATSRAYAFRYNEDLDEDKDILGLALANGAAGLTGTFVVNGSPTKTEIADSAGSRSQLASLVTAFVVLLVLLFFTKPISFMPNATLASIVFLIGLNMIDIRGLNDIRSKIKSEYYLAIITAFTVIFVSVLWGIVISIVLSLLLHLSHSYRPVNSILVKNKEDKWMLVPVEYGKSTEDGIIAYRFNRDLYYANSDLLHDEIIKLVESADPPLRWFVLDAGGFEAMDYTSSQMFKNLHHELAKRNVKFVITTRMPELKDQLEHLGLMKIIGPENIYNSAFEAIDAFESENSK